EAQACGVPVVGAATPGVAAVVSADHTGLLVPVGDVAATAAATRRLIDDAALRARMSAAAVAYVREHHDVPRAAAQLDALLRDACAAHRVVA
ncbi:MAG TPA: glycosyltransferase, partial [Casimicrobiaceae bacterium]|nr:glycosyltransferase [Casimicrobiaceae bacterium]